MSSDALTFQLLASAAAIAVLHTAIGPDHTLPFVMLARARKWSLSRTLVVTALCGLAHAGSSLVLGAIGVLLGASTASLEHFEGRRGEVAAWGMVLFGALYALWGLRGALRRRHGLALHEHQGHVHLHPDGERPHAHGLDGSRLAAHSVNFWTLFTVFVLGPCEPLIPLFFLPASNGDWFLAAATALVFTTATVATMLALVGSAHVGLALIDIGRLERWTHPLAGGVIAASGLAVLFGGL